MKKKKKGISHIYINYFFDNEFENLESCWEMGTRSGSCFETRSIICLIYVNEIRKEPK